MKKIKTGSDFSGVGAFDQALAKMGIDQDKKFACDLDKYARQTYIENYGEPSYYPYDVYDRKIPKESLDIYMSSPPCQAFSLKGKREGENEKRGILFYNSHEFIVKNKPRYFIFENVKGLLSDSNGRTFKNWLDMLGGKTINGNPVIFPREDSTPYHIYYRVLNSRHYGVPQNRERVFIIGIRDDSDNTFQFPKPFHLKKRLIDVLEKKVDKKYFLSDKINIPRTENYPFNPLTNNADELILTNNKRLNINLKKHKGKLKNGMLLDSYNLTTYTDYSCTIDTRISASNNHHLIQDLKIRRLTPRECFRLMDFPDTFKMPCSNSQMYKQAGNSIAVNVLVEIINKLKL
jgi:DNA (cytosine-5)-methyltransferase 1